MTTITALPEPPSRDDPTNFRARADAFMLALPDFATETNAVATELNAASAASIVAAAEAAASASEVVAVSNVTKWLSGTTYAEGDAVWSPVNYQTYRRITAGAGTTDPSLDPATWAAIGNITGPAGSNLYLANLCNAF
jgi:hypothetical protein